MQIRAVNRQSEGAVIQRTKASHLITDYVGKLAAKFPAQFTEGTASMENLTLEQFLFSPGGAIDEGDLGTGNTFLDGFVCYLFDLEVYTLGSAQQYLSAAINYYKVKYPLANFPRGTNWELNTSHWFKSLKDQFVRRATANRTELTTHRVGVTECDNVIYCRYMFQRGHHETCFLQAMDWTNGGRVSEAARMSWKDMQLVTEASQEEVRCYLAVS
jgi:hypothetical protein